MVLYQSVAKKSDVSASVYVFILFPVLWIEYRLHCSFHPCQSFFCVIVPLTNKDSSLIIPVVAATGWVCSAPPAGGFLTHALRSIVYWFCGFLRLIRSSNHHWLSLHCNYCFNCFLLACGYTATMLVHVLGNLWNGMLQNIHILFEQNVFVLFELQLWRVIVDIVMLVLKSGDFN